MIEMKVSALSMDPFTNMPILLLRDDTGQHALPIWVGLIEASAIVTELEQIHLARPMTHDLIRDILGKVGAQVDRVEVTDVHEDTFFAQIHLRTECAGKARTFSVDARPSDAIALALRTGAPILVAQKVIERARCIDLAKLGPFAWVAEQADGPYPPVAKGKGPCQAAVAAEALQGLQLEDLADDEFPKWKM